MEVRGELPGHGLLWQPRQGEWAVAVVVKATFDLVPGEVKLSAAQDLLSETDTYWDGDGSRSLLMASDLAPTKPLCDVVLVGHAYTPRGSASRQTTVRLAFEDIDKSIEVRTDRSVGPDGTIYQGNRWTRMPLVYERAAGGPGTWNPVGVHPASRDLYGRTPLPNLVPKGRADDAAIFPEPLGFGPIAPSWPARAERLGYHPPFSGALLAAQPLPDTFDRGWFNAAPIDQQLAAIPEDGHLLLENLSPIHPVLTTKLSGVRPRVVAERRAGRETVAMRADTLWIDVDRAQLFVIWRGQLPLDHPNEEARLRVDVDRPRASWQTVQHAVSAEPAATDSTRASAASAPSSRAHDAASRAQGALPFSNAAARARTSQGQVEPIAAPHEALPFQQTGTRQMTAVSAGLPFRAKNTDAVVTPSVPPEPQAPPSMAGEVTSTTPFGTQTPSWGAAMPPFQAQPSAPAYAAPAYAPPAAPPPAAPPPSFGASPPAPVPVVAMPMPAPMPAPPDVAWSGGGAALHPPAVVQHAGAAALGGLVTASNAAADPSVANSRAGGAPRRIEGDVLHLLWFDAEIAPRIHRRPEWKKILDALEAGPFDPDIDQPALSEDPSELEDRREVFEVLARGTPTGQDGVDRALLDAVRADGRFAPQLLLMLGELRFDFDELEQLKANVSAATPFADKDEELKKVLDSTTQFLATPDLVSSPDVATAMSKRIQDAFAASSRPVAASYLDEQTERALLERRAYQKRNVFGAPHLRCLFFFAGSDTGIPTYLPEAVAKKIPLFRRLRVRLLIEAHFQADQFESHAAALRAVAIARIVR